MNNHGMSLIQMGVVATVGAILTLGGYQMLSSFSKSSASFEQKVRVEGDLEILMDLIAAQIKKRRKSPGNNPAFASTGVCTTGQNKMTVEQESDGASAAIHQVEVETLCGDAQPNLDSSLFSTATCASGQWPTVKVTTWPNQATPQVFTSRSFPLAQGGLGLSACFTDHGGTSMTVHLTSWYRKPNGQLTPSSLTKTIPTPPVGDIVILK